MESHENRCSTGISEAGTDLRVSQDSTLALLQRADLPATDIEQLAKDSAAMASRKVRVAVVKHPHTPRHVALPTLRLLFTFDLMNVALVPTVPPDIKNAAEDVLINRIESIASGERLALARRASGKVACALLGDTDPRVMSTALDNPRLTEVLLIKALSGGAPTPQLIEAVCHHSKWSLRRDVRIALLRSEKTSLACALTFARELPATVVRDVLHGSLLPARTLRYLRAELKLPESD